MNRESLNKAIAGAKFSFYEAIAKLIVDNPTVALADHAQLTNVRNFGY